MAARGEEKEIGKSDIGGEARGQRVRLEMVDGDERLAAGQRHALARHQPDQHAADEAGPRGRRHAVEVLRRDARPPESARDQ